MLIRSDPSNNEYTACAAAQDIVETMTAHATYSIVSCIVLLYCKTYFQILSTCRKENVKSVKPTILCLIFMIRYFCNLIMKICNTDSLDKVYVVTRYNILSQLPLRKAYQ